jgi:DNA mismatch repair protein MutS2
LLSALARTPPGRRVLSRLTPAFDEAEIRRRLSETEELFRFRLEHGRLPLAGVDEVAGVLDALADAGGFVQSPELRPILAVARATEAVGNALAQAGSQGLRDRRLRLPSLSDLLERARRLFDTDGTVRDEASSELSRLRNRLRRRRAEVARGLERLLDTRREILGDAVVVLRNDRYCLPVMASARARMPGIVHDRSGSGQTVFVEPMEVIESNNELALLAAEERREVERLLTEFGREVLARGDDLETALEELAELDALEAKIEFGEITEGRIPELSDDGGWTLCAARHPLLDPRLGPLRRRVLGEARQRRGIVPLDLALASDRRLLVISGPNAGGKTVVLKTAGLFVLLTQSGIPVPAGPGTRLPVFQSVRAEIGDAQQILTDQSTFSSSMETLARIVDETGPDGLALVDEIGSATDPEEGSALAIAWLEEFLARGGRAIVTTHLSAIKNFAAARPDAICAAMEFDETTGRPNYRIHPGLSGRSRALSVARESGMPEQVLVRAREVLGEAWRRQEVRETEAEAALERVRELERELASERDRARTEAERLSAEREKMSKEKRRIIEQELDRFETARRDLARRVEKEIAGLRADSAHRAGVSSARLVAGAAEKVEAETGIDQARGELAVRSDEIAVGGHARLLRGRAEGTVASIEGDFVWLDVAGKRMRMPRAELEPLSPGRGTRNTGHESTRPTASRVPSPESPDSSATLTHEVNVIGQRLDEAIEAVEKALDEALVAGARLRVIHGHGTGRLREGIREHLRNHRSVASARAADPREGGNGATVVELK